MKGFSFSVLIILSHPSSQIESKINEPPILHLDENKNNPEFYKFEETKWTLWLTQFLNQIKGKVEFLTASSSYWCGYWKNEFKENSESFYWLYKRYYEEESLTREQRKFFEDFLPPLQEVLEEYTDRRFISLSQREFSFNQNLSGTKKIWEAHYNIYAIENHSYWIREFSSPSKETIKQYYSDSIWKRINSGWTMQEQERCLNIEREDWIWIKFPPSLIIAQAILESWWGTSYYSIKKNNPFGIYKFDRKGKRTIRTFNSFKESIAYYLENYRKHPSYKEFIESLSDWFKIQNLHLIRDYSESEEYIGLIQKIIKDNNLQVFDFLPIQI